MSVLLPFPVFRAFTTDGNPLSAGKLFSYAPGTSTPKATFTDSTGLTPNANPVVLDANGAANVWLSGNYKLVLENSLAVVQWTVDNVPGLDGTTQAEVTVTPTAGTAIATATALVPAGARLVGVTARVTTGIGTTQGMDSFNIGHNFGGNSLVDAWGRTIALALNTVTTGANWTSSDQPVALAAGDIILAANNGLWDGTGAIKIRVFYASYASPS